MFSHHMCWDPCFQRLSLELAPGTDIPGWKAVRLCEGRW